MSASTTRPQQSLESCKHWGLRDFHFLFYLKWVVQSFNCSSDCKCQLLSHELYLLLLLSGLFGLHQKNRRKIKKRRTNLPEQLKAGQQQCAQGPKADKASPLVVDSSRTRTRRYDGHLPSFHPWKQSHPLMWQSGQVTFHFTSALLPDSNDRKSCLQLIYTQRSRSRVLPHKSIQTSTFFTCSLLKRLSLIGSLQGQHTWLSWRMYLQPTPTSCLLASPQRKKSESYIV